jgi:hypothetical protein
MNDNIDYRLNGVNVIEFSIKEMGTDSKSIEIKSLLFEVTADIKLNTQVGLVGVFVTVTISTQKKSGDDYLARMKNLIGFEIRDFDSIVLPNSKGILEIPIKLEAAMRRIAISTSRGLLYAYLSPTYLKGAFLPIIPELLTPKSATKKKDTKI